MILKPKIFLFMNVCISSNPNLCARFDALLLAIRPRVDEIRSPRIYLASNILALRTLPKLTIIMILEVIFWLAIGISHFTIQKNFIKSFLNAVRVANSLNNVAQFLGSISYKEVVTIVAEWITFFAQIFVLLLEVMNLYKGKPLGLDIGI